VTKSWLDGWDWRPSADPLPTSHGWRMHDPNAGAGP
jgi:hypothetical protein